MTLLPELRLSDTVKARTAPTASVTVASATEIDGGPATVADVEWLSLRSSSVQMPRLLLQLVVAGSVMLIVSFPSGSTVIVQALFLSADCGFLRWARVTSPSSTVKAWFLSVLKLTSGFSLKCNSKVNSLPSCSEGIPEKEAVSGSTRRLRIVPVAVLVPRSAPAAFDSVTVNVSSLSFSTSFSIETEIVLLVSPAEKLSVPLLAV